jgi:RimJ/RimL family protein N-acetyltransferase
MSALEDWPPAPILQTPRLSLEPLRIDHAQEMASVLDDPRLFAFTGGSPCTLDELRDRYQRQVTGWSHDRHERWLNWILRERGTGQAIGTTQATITIDGDAVIGAVAWIVGSRHQRRGTPAKRPMRWRRGCASRARGASSLRFTPNTRPR